MKGLNRIFKDFERLREKCLEISPDESGDLNNIFNSFMQIFENLAYENIKGNTKRYLGMNEDVPIESVLVVLDDILKNLDAMNKAMMEDAIGVLGAQLEHIKWDVDNALKSVNRIQTKLEKNK